MVKQVAATLTSILDDAKYQKITNCTLGVGPLVEQMIDDWSLDLYTRNPGPAVNANGEFQGTDLDLATFVMALAQRGAVINLPEYKSMRASSKREGERLISKDNRHGKIMNVYANQDVFSFGVRINDVNVIQQTTEGEETAGAPRNFTLVDVNGDWYEGWKYIEFLPTAKENSFLNEKGLWTGNKVVFKNFVHPNRWISFYGRPYFLAKLMQVRLTEEAKHLKKGIDFLIGEGCRYPETGDEAKKEWPKTEKVGDEKTITVKTLLAEIDVPEIEGEYPDLQKSDTELANITKIRRTMLYDWLPKLRFATRAVEYAFANHGIVEGNVGHGIGRKPIEKFPSWFQDATWERDYISPGKRAKWNRLILFQPAVGELGVSLRYRLMDKIQRVAAD